MFYLEGKSLICSFISGIATNKQILAYSFRSSNDFEKASKIILENLNPLLKWAHPAIEKLGQDFDELSSMLFSIVGKHHNELDCLNHFYNDNLTDDLGSKSLYHIFINIIIWSYLFLIAQLKSIFNQGTT